jgi:predicted SnoaL-like aldol condensation-catalyzing enzyme
MSQEELNKRLVLDAFDTLFNRRDYVAAANYWSPHYLQHSAHSPPGREGLFDLIRGVPMSLRYESQLILANRDFVMVHGRFSNTGRARNWVAVDIVRIGGGLLVEHWDVLQDEASKAQSLSGLPMFGNEFVD